jgi:hypothetical protein
MTDKHFQSAVATKQKCTKGLVALFFRTAYSKFKLGIIWTCLLSSCSTTEILNNVFFRVSVGPGILTSQYRPHRPWGPPSLLSMGTDRLFLRASKGDLYIYPPIYLQGIVLNYSNAEPNLSVTVSYQ